MHITQAPCCIAHFGAGKPLPHYSAPLYQVGSGYFSELVQRFIPILTQKVAPYVGRKLLDTGRHIAEEVRQGTSFGEAVKKGVGRTYHSTRDELLQKLKGKGVSNKSKRKRAVRSVKPAKRRRRVDFFT